MRLPPGLVGVLAMAWAGPVLAQAFGLADVDRLSASPPTKVEAYGAGALQYGELRLPKGRGPFPVVEIIHGGCWTRGFATLSYMRPLASDLARKGVATWTIEYRQVGDPGGGWPGTFLDWAAATDHLRGLAKTYPLDLSRVVVAGHSAGGHAALWIAGRGKLPPASPVRGGPPLKVAAAVDIDGPGDLAAFALEDAAVCGEPVIAPLMGGAPGAVPARYAQGSPIALLPLHGRQYLVSAQVLAPADAEAYRRAATAKGDRVEVASFKDASHFDLVAPTRPAGAAVEALILRAVAQSRPR